MEPGAAPKPSGSSSRATPAAIRATRGLRAAGVRFHLKLARFGQYNLDRLRSSAGLCSSFLGEAPSTFFEEQSAGSPSGGFRSLRSFPREGGIAEWRAGCQIADTARSTYFGSPRPGCAAQLGRDLKIGQAEPQASCAGGGFRKLMSRCNGSVGATKSIATPRRVDRAAPVNSMAIACKLCRARHAPASRSAWRTDDLLIVEPAHERPTDDQR